MLIAPRTLQSYRIGGTARRTRPIWSYAPWAIQVLLALVCLSAGGIKLFMSAEDLREYYPFPALFMRFIGVAELLGAIGLILPGALRIRRELTPMAASGLVVIMIGATVVTLAEGDVASALIPLAVLLLSASVVYTRRAWLTGSLTFVQLKSR